MEPDTDSPGVAALTAWATEAARGNVVDAVEVAAYAESVAALGLSPDSYYAECRLNAPRQLDLLFSFEPANPCLAGLSARFRGCAERRTPEARHAWETAASFVERWSTVGDPLHDAVHTVWLEFDDVRRPLELAAPSLSACVVPSYGQTYDPRRATAPDTRYALTVAYRALAGDVAGEGMIRRIARVVDALPAYGRFIHLSQMTARAHAATKLYAVFPREELVPYLSRIGYRGSLQAVRGVLERFATRVHCGDYLYVDLDLSTFEHTDRASLGVAFSQQQVASLSPHDPGRGELLSALVAGGLCRPAQADALRDWSSAGAGGSWCDRRVRRWLDIKLVISATGELTTKAYLGFGPRRSPFARAAA